MEHSTLNAARKQFSRVGMVLFVGTLLIIAIQTLVDNIAVKIPALAGNASLFFLIRMLSMYIIAYPIIFFLLKRIPAAADIEQKKMSFKQIMAAFFVAYAATYILNFLANMLTVLIVAIKQSPVDNVMLNLVTNISPAANFLAVVICAPIMEELLFRKAVIDRTVHYGKAPSIIFSGLLFGLFHGNLVQFAYAFFLGIFFGFIYVTTKNIVYPIILHMMLNFLGSFVGTFILEWSGYMKVMQAAAENATDAEIVAAMMENAGGMTIYLLYALCIIGFVIAGIIIFIINRKKFALPAEDTDLPRGQRFRTMFLNPGALLFCIFWISMIILQLAV